MAYSSVWLRAVSLTALLVALLAVAASSPAFAAKTMTTLRVIVQDEQGEPIPRASVVVTRMKGDKLKGRPLQLKTSNDGSAPLPPLQQGPYMVQVINSGHQTHGEKVELNESEQTHTVTLKPPTKQFSVHTAK